MKTLIKLLAGAAFGLAVVSVASVLSLASEGQQPVRVATADKIRSVEIGESELYFHFEQAAEVFELHVMVVSEGAKDDILQTRVRIRDGQQFAMVLHDEIHPEDHKGHRVIFNRVGDSVIVDTVEAAPETRIASLIWPFN